MTMISEIAIFEASTPNVDLANPASPFKVSLQEHLRTMLSFGGAQAAYCGQLIETPQNIIVFINWNSLDAHIEATKSRAFPALEASFRSNLIRDNGRATIFHVTFQGNLLDALQPRSTSSTETIGDTEIVLAYFQPSPLLQAAKDAILDSFSHMEPVIERNGGLTGYRNGWAVEGLSAPLVERGDVAGAIEGDCAVYVNLTGWVDREAHMRFMETEEFRENQHWFLDVEGLRGAEIVHARFFEVSGMGG